MLNTDPKLVLKNSGNSWFISYSDQSFEEAQASVKRAVEMYHEARPHQALTMRTPMQVVDNHHDYPLLNTTL